MSSLPDSLKNKIPDFQNTRMDQSSKAKIQKVQPYLRERKDFADYYFPKLVSIGPIHHHKNTKMSNLEQGEHYKKKWALMYIERMEGPETETTETKVEKLLGKILSEIKDLRDLYAEDAIQGQDDELAWMFFIDGCAVLHFMEKASFTSSDGVEIKEDQQVIVQQDLFLLENQLPYRVLKLLSNDDDAKLRRCIDKFLQMHHMIPDHQVSNTVTNKPEEHQVAIPAKKEPIHLLDLLRSAILHVEGHNTHDEQKHPRRRHLIDHLCSMLKGGEEKRKKNKYKWPTHRNIQELKSSGIGIRPDENARLTNISFRGRKIFLSKLMVDDFTAPTFSNMIAYEMCPDFKNNYEISSYMSFMNSLIDHADDVKELRRVGVLHNSLGTDEDVAKIFNTVSTDMVIETSIYKGVRKAIEKRYRNKFNIRMAEVYHKHFSSPWAIIGLLAAFLGLFLTGVQTFAALNQSPPPTPCPCH